MNEPHKTPLDELGSLADRWGHLVAPETLQMIAETAGAVRREAAAWGYDSDDVRDAANWRDVLTVTRVIFVAHAAREAPAAPRPASGHVDQNDDMDPQAPRGLRKTGQGQNRRKSVAKPVASPSDADGYTRWLTTSEKQAIDAFQPKRYRERAKPGMSVAQVLDFELFCELGNRNFWTAVPSARTVYNRRRWFARNGVWHVLQTTLGEPKSVLCRQLGEQRRLELMPIIERLCREAEAIGSGNRRRGKFNA